MTKHKSTWIELTRLALPLAVIALGAAGFGWLSSKREVPLRASEPKGPPLVETVTLNSHDGALDIEVDGLVVPSRVISLPALVAGRIVYKSPECKAGNYVSKGTLLFEIEPADYELEARRLNEELRQAEVDIRETNVEIENTRSLISLAEEDLQLQRNELNRLMELGGKQVISESEIDQGRRSELAARNALMTLKNQQSLYETRKTRFERARDLVAVQLERAKLDLDRTKIVSPLDGVISREAAEQDSYAEKGTELAVITDTATVEVKCSLRMEELYWLLLQGSESGDTLSDSPKFDYEIPRTPVTVIYELAGSKFAWGGILSRYEGIGLDEKTRTIPCRVVVANPRAVRSLESGQPVHDKGPRALERGMYVTVRLHARPEVELFSLPESALRPGNVVWRVADGKLEIAEVHVAEVVNGRVLLHRGASTLAAGDRVVISPISVARHGMIVREVEN